MPSGLHKPGTVPFLALILFALLSLVPTLVKEWDFYSVHLAYLGLPRYDSTTGRYSSSRGRNASIDTRSRLKVTGDECKSWLFGDLYSTCSDSSAQPYQSIRNAPTRSSFEAGAEPPKDPITFSVVKEPSSITRGVTAFKDFVIKRWDDQQTAQSIPLQQDLADDISEQPTPTPASVIPPSEVVEEEQEVQHDERYETSLMEDNSENSPLLEWSLFLHETWQQVCHTGGYYLESLIRPPTHNNTLETPNSSMSASDEQTQVAHIRPEKQHAGALIKRSLANNNSLIESDLSSGLEDSQQASASLPNSPATTAGQSKYTGFRRDSDYMRGSSMAIVIALIAGIVWF
ncbi:hypothetical protein BJX70DRAFT_400153 [Aspergillus crustosus]